MRPTAKKNPKVFWKYSQTKLKTKAGIPNLKKTQDSNNSTDSTQPDYATTDREKTTVFSEFFSSVFTEEPPHDELPYFETRKVISELHNINITHTMIKKTN